MKFKSDSEIDRWLQNLSKEEISKVWKVTKLLKGYFNETGSTLFRIPPQDVNKSGLDKTTLEAVLTKLYQLDVILVQLFQKETFTPQPKITTTEWLDWPNMEDVILKSNTWIGIEPDLFGYLYFRLEEIFHKDKERKPKIIWQPDLEKLSGILKLPDNVEFKFRGGTFGGINEFFKNDEYITTKERLRESMSKYLQGRRKNPKEINISKWKSDLKKRNPKFFKYLDIKYIPPETYQLVYKS